MKQACLIKNTNEHEYIYMQVPCLFGRQASDYFKISYLRKKFNYLLLLTFFLFTTNYLSGQQDTIFNQTDSNGLKQGFWKKYYQNGNIMYTGCFKNDMPVGEMKRYFESGNLKALLIYGEKENFAQATLYFEDGVLASEGYYLNLKKDSIWKFYSYYNKNLVARESYKNGKKSGLSFCYYENGAVAEKIVWNDGIKNGIWEQYFEDGSLRLKSSFINGKLSGEFIVYQGKDMLLVKGKYMNDLPDGLWVFYNEEGTESDKINYVGGKPENEAELNDKQQEYFKNIDKNIGRFNEPDINDFYPQNKNNQGDY